MKLNEEEINEGLRDIANAIKRKGVEFTKSLWVGVKRESSETKDMLKILQKMLKGHPVSKEDNFFVKNQAKDLIKIVPLVTISSLPIPIPITPFLVALGEKYGFSFLPDSHKKQFEMKTVRNYDEWLLESRTSEYTPPKYLVSPALDVEGNQIPSDKIHDYLVGQHKTKESYFKPGIRSANPPEFNQEHDTDHSLDDE